MDKITVGVLTISERCFWGEAEDTSGPRLRSMLERGVVKNCIVVKSHLVSDRSEDIEKVLKEWSDESINLILTTGGTGVASTDVTPEATTAVVDKLVPGISQLMFKKSSEVTPLAALSRSVAGVRNKSLIVNLPGSRKAAEECLQAIAGVIPHAIDLIIGRKNDVEKVHSSLGKKQSSVKESDPARRKTTSPYERIPVRKAQEIILESVYFMKKEVFVGYEEALDHILAQDVPARVNLPPFDVSLKDGYAVRSDDKNCIRNVVGVSKMGDQPSVEALPPNSCVRISTGAAMPSDTDAVVVVEETSPVKSEGDNNESIEILGRLPSKGQDVRKKGSDFRVGNLLFPFGSYLDAAAIGLCAGAGVTSLKVFKKPLVAVISTGDELISPEEPASTGKVWDSNRITLISLLKEHGFKALDCGIVKDEPDALRDALEKAFQEADVVVSTGSMSMGERDYLKDILVADFDADIHFGRVLMKPGLPTTFATVIFEEKMKMFFGLPGNPASAFVTSNLFLLPALRRISGRKNVLPREVTVNIPEKEYIPLEDRPHYVRGTFLGYSGLGYMAKITGDQRSSRISSCVNANCLLLFPPKSLPPEFQANALKSGLCTTAPSEKSTFGFGSTTGMFGNTSGVFVNTTAPSEKSTSRFGSTTGVFGNTTAASENSKLIWGSTTGVFGNTAAASEKSTFVFGSTTGGFEKGSSGISQSPSGPSLPFKSVSALLIGEFLFRP